MKNFITCNQVKEDEMGRICRMHGENRNPYRIVVGKAEEMRPICMWKDNIKMDLRSDGVVWTRLLWLKIRTSGGLL
jgi:hypothetical protein